MVSLIFSEALGGGLELARGFSRACEFLHFRALRRWVWWGRRFRLPSGTGPGPALRRVHQTRTNRVRFNVGSCSVDLIRVAKVMVPGLVLPKWLPCSAKDPIGVPRRRSFQPSHQHCHRNPRKNQQMYVVFHNRPGAKLVETSLGGPGHNRAGHQICKASIREPRRPRAVPVQSHEGMFRQWNTFWAGTGEHELAGNGAIFGGIQSW